MGVRTRGLDIKPAPCATPLTRPRAPRLKVVIQRWNEQLSLGRDMLWSPTIRAAPRRRSQSILEAARRLAGKDAEIPRRRVFANRYDTDRVRENLFHFAEAQSPRV
jgi:hypothetical protein